MKAKIAPKKITAWLKARGLCYEDIQIRSNGALTIDQIKYAMSKSLMMKESQVQILALILNCEFSDLVDPDFYSKLQIPVEVQLLVSEFYSSSTKNFSQAYREYMKRTKKKPTYQAISHQSAVIYMHLTENHNEKDEFGKVLKVRDFILSQFTEITQTAIFESISINIMTWFRGNLSALPDDEHLAISLFILAYCLLIFDELLHHELVSSAIFLSQYRHREVIDQYAAIALPMEKMCVSLLDIMLNKGGFDSFENLKALQFEETVMEKIILVVAASKQIVNHIKQPGMASEYLNRSKVDRLIQELLLIFEEMDIPVEYDILQDFPTSRFGSAYLDYRHTRALIEGSASTNSNIHVKSIESECLTSFMAGISKEVQEYYRMQQTYEFICNFFNPKANSHT